MVKTYFEYKLDPFQTCFEKLAEKASLKRFVTKEDTREIKAVQYSQTEMLFPCVTTKQRADNCPGPTFEIPMTYRVVSWFLVPKVPFTLTS